MNKKLLFIINPHSGKGKIKGKLLEIIDIFVKSGWDVVVHTTQKVQDACDTVSDIGADFDRIVVSGGDGTLNEVIRGIMEIPEEKRPEVGYIPAGTTNDFASNMNISRNMIKASQSIVNGTPFMCDVGGFNKKHFAYVAAFGAFADVSYETPQQYKNTLGQLAYFLEGIKKIYNLPYYKMKVTCDDRIIEDEFMLGMVSNSNRIAGIKTKKALKAQFNDGLFEVLLIKRPKTLMEVSDLATRLLTQDISSDLITVLRTSKIQFQAEEPIPWTLDGEFGGSLRTANISVKKEAVKLII